MRFKAILREALPPFILTFIRRCRQPRLVAEQRPEWQYLPEGWDYLRQHPEAHGWNVQSILDVYQRKWPRFAELVAGTGPLGVAHESDLATNQDICAHNAAMVFGYALTLAGEGKDSVSLLDWGGGIGHFFLLGQALLPGKRLIYTAKDMPLMAECGRRFVPGQRFVSDDSECLRGKYDLVLASCSLHYEQDWRSRLRSLAHATGRYLLVTSLPVVMQSPSFVFVQRPSAYGYKTEYVAWCLNRDDVLACAAACGLTLVREVVVGHSPDIDGAPERCIYWGFLFRPSTLNKTEVSYVG